METASSTDFVSPLRRISSGGKTKVDDAELVLVPAFCSQKERPGKRRFSGGELSKIADTNTPIPLSKRFASFGRPDFIDHGDEGQSRKGTEFQFKEELTIPVKDIIKISTPDEDDDKNKKSPKRRNFFKKTLSSKGFSRDQKTIRITTSSFGSYELLMESTNERLVLMTFLKVNLKNLTAANADDPQKGNTIGIDRMRSNGTLSDRIRRSFSERVRRSFSETIDLKKSIDEFPFALLVESNSSNVTSATTPSQLSNGSGSFDVEAFTAKRMSERLEKETLTEKLEQRMHRIVSSIDELSTSLTKCACLCFVDHTLSPGKENRSRTRRNTDSTVSSSEDTLEVDPALSTEEPDLPQPVSPPRRKTTTTTVTTTPTTGNDPATPTRAKLMLFAQLPSGLSVEADDESVEVMDSNHQQERRVPWYPQPDPLMASDI